MERFRAGMLETVTAVLTERRLLPLLRFKQAELRKSSYMYVNTANVRDEINTFDVCDCMAYLVI